MWDLPQFQALAARQGVVEVNYTGCNYGHKRPKETKLLTTIAGLQALNGPCNGVHYDRHQDEHGVWHLHAPWGFKEGKGFATAEEAEYPLELCCALLTFMGIPDPRIIPEDHLDEVGLGPADDDGPEPSAGTTAGAEAEVPEVDAPLPTPIGVPPAGA